MSQAYATLTDNQKAEIQSLDAAQLQAARCLLGLFTAQRKHQALWNAVGPTLGLLDSNEQVQRASELASVFAAQTRSVGDMTNLANALAAIYAAAYNGTNLGYLAQMVGPENVL